ncbi:MAG: hypothetical protein PUP92_23205 [Rhizonema sp. PD38]|nr:hypothetical protein [Rhizonema sp. PD38]
MKFRQLHTIDYYYSFQETKKFFRSLAIRTFQLNVARRQNNLLVGIERRYQSTLQRAIALKPMLNTPWNARAGTLIFSLLSQSLWFTEFEQEPIRPFPVNNTSVLTLERSHCASCVSPDEKELALTMPPPPPVVNTTNVYKGELKLYFAYTPYTLHIQQWFQPSLTLHSAYTPYTLPTHKYFCSL